MVKLFARHRLDVLCTFGWFVFIESIGLRAQMGVIHCCGGKRKTKSYSLSPGKEYILAEFDYLEECPVCGHTVAQLTRIDYDNNISFCRKINDKARKFFENIKNSIAFEKKSKGYTLKASSGFYLNYNEFGIKKKCYSNLSTLKIGLFENKKLDYIEKKLISSTHKLSYPRQKCLLFFNYPVGGFFQIPPKLLFLPYFIIIKENTLENTPLLHVA